MKLEKLQEKVDRNHTPRGLHFYRISRFFINQICNVTTFAAEGTTGVPSIRISPAEPLSVSACHQPEDTTNNTDPHQWEYACASMQSLNELSGEGKQFKRISSVWQVSYIIDVCSCLWPCGSQHHTMVSQNRPWAVNLKRGRGGIHEKWWYLLNTTKKKRIF